MNKVEKKQIITSFRYSISKGYVKPVLERLNHLCESNELFITNDVILNLNRLIELRKNLSRGIIPYEEYQMNYSKVVYSTLQLLDEIEESISEHLEDIAKTNPEKEQIKKLFILFERAVFNAPTFGEHPSLMLEAFRNTRIALQMNGATLLENFRISLLFKEIIDDLQCIEFEIRATFPDVETALRKGRLDIDDSNSIPNGQEAVLRMIKSREIINERVEYLKYLYRNL